MAYILGVGLSVDINDIGTLRKSLAMVVLSIITSSVFFLHLYFRKQHHK